MGSLTSDFRKLFRLSMLAVAVAWIGSVSFLIAFYSSSAESQYQIAMDNYEHIANPVSQAELCEFLQQPVGPACDQAREEELGFATRFLREAAALYPLAAAAQDPVGVGGIVAGFMASLIGAVVIGGIAAAHVGGEWNHGTIKVLLARDPRRLRFVVVKFVTIWFAAVCLMLIAWLTVAVLSVTFRQLFAAPPSPPGFDMWEYAAGQVFRSLVVLGVFAALGTGAGVLLRNSLGALGTVLGIVFVSLMACAWRPTFQASPGYWVAAWMGFGPETLWADHLWVDRFPLVNPDPAFQPNEWIGLLGLAVTVILGLAVAGIRVVRSDVGG